MELKDIYTLHSGMVYTLALSYLKNKEDAEEVTQDVFLLVHEHLDRFRKEASHKTWIYRITINKCLDFIKASKRKKRSIFNNSTKLEEYSAVEFIHPGVLLENKEAATILLNCIDELPESQKTAFLLSKMDGLTYAEIAEIMERSVSSIEAILFRAKQNLKKVVERKWEDYHKKS